LAKPCGYRLPASSTLCFAKRCMAVLPPGLAPALGPVLEQIASMTVKIKQYDRAIQRLTETEYTETQALIQVYGVGQFTALTYVLTLGSKQRFQRSRDVAATSACGRDAASPGTAIRSSASPRPATSTCVLCWSSAPTMCSGAWKRLNPATVGPASSLAGRQAVPQSGHRRRRSQARRPASSHLGHTRAIPTVLCSSCLRIRIMFPVARPRVPMTACRIGPSQGRPKTGSIDFSL
jgi:hypothetical protein